MPGRHNSTKESGKIHQEKARDTQREKRNRVGDEDAIGGL